jgi:hypothetical protein
LQRVHRHFAFLLYNGVTLSGQALRVSHLYILEFLRYRAYLEGYCPTTDGFEVLGWYTWNYVIAKEPITEGKVRYTVMLGRSHEYVCPRDHPAVNNSATFAKGIVPSSACPAA